MNVLPTYKCTAKQVAMLMGVSARTASRYIATCKQQLGIANKAILTMRDFDRYMGLKMFNNET